jgi:hypothetical protein
LFCASCGAGEQSANAYCKRCGEWLSGDSGIASRALWGQGVKPAQKLKTILVRLVLSAALALASAMILLTGRSDPGNFPALVKAAAILCLLVAGMQVDGFFVALRMQRDFKRNRADAERTLESEAHSVPATAPERAQFASAPVEAEATTRELDSLPLSGKRVE